MQQAMHPHKKDLNTFNLNRIKSNAIENYKNFAPDPRTDSEHFLAQCWTDAVISELYKMGLIDFIVYRANVEEK